MKKIFLIAASLCFAVSLSAGVWDNVQATKEAITKQCLVSGIKFYMRAEDALERVQEFTRLLGKDAACVCAAVKCMLLAPKRAYELTSIRFQDVFMLHKQYLESTTIEAQIQAFKIYHMLKNTEDGGGYVEMAQERIFAEMKQYLCACELLSRLDSEKPSSRGVIAMARNFLACYFLMLMVSEESMVEAIKKNHGCGEYFSPKFHEAWSHFLWKPFLEEHLKMLKKEAIEPKCLDAQSCDLQCVAPELVIPEPNTDPEASKFIDTLQAKLNEQFANEQLAAKLKKDCSTVRGAL